MEINNFEEQLCKVIAQTDQKSNNSSNKERVWANINTRTYTKKSWYYAAAVIFILGFSTVLVFNKTPENVGVKKEKIDPQIVKNNVTKPKQIQNRDTEIETPSLPSLKSKQIYQNRNFKIVPLNDTLIAKNPEQRLDLKLPLQNEVVLAEQKIAGTKTIINETAAPQPEFTVQFKRGKQIETTVENQIKIATTFKKLSFGRDTITFANANAQKNILFKIKF